MVIDTAERDEIEKVIKELESLASGMPEHSSIRVGQYRLAASLRLLLKKSVVTNLGRGKP